ncbi:MAG: 3-deoxy-7-phosphoheptulonate synthase AroG [Proteobacteria bacterium]|nr:3-deoxy-7-phosphoheptulonate synthase AroG [Pseudomonadota bacterium]
MSYQTDDLKIVEIKELMAPSVLRSEYPITDNAARCVHMARADVQKILHGKDDRLLVIVGPCSIHDADAASEYAGRLLALRKKLIDDLVIIMRVYFEKPRTTVGWKGLINDPNLDGSFEINKGLRIARKLLLDLNEMGLPAGTEYLDLVSPQYVADLVSWGAIGARTTESQVHRELASGLSCPVGFKNATSGDMQVAVDAVGSATHPHHFLSVTKAGRSAIFSTTGNPDCHVILRGGREPNYNQENINSAARMLEKSGLEPRLMVDFSHANSFKQHDKQMEVGQSIVAQFNAGDTRIFGVMIESHLVAGRQDAKPGTELTYGQSITDACMGWETTDELLHMLAGAVRVRRDANSAVSAA